jgi:hypothetical protein
MICGVNCALRLSPVPRLRAGYCLTMKDNVPDYVRRRRHLRILSTVLVTFLLLAFGDHLYRVVNRPPVKRAVFSVASTTTTVAPIQSFNQYEDTQYGRQCGNYSPSTVSIDFWNATENSCAPSWLRGVTTFANMEDDWYGHACGDYLPTRKQLQAFNDAKFHCPGHVTNYLPPLDK